MDGINQVTFEDSQFLAVYGSAVLAVGITTSFTEPANFLGTNPEALQKAVSGADRGTAKARKKLEAAIHRYRTAGHKNPGLLKVARAEIKTLPEARAHRVFTLTEFKPNVKVDDKAFTLDGLGLPEGFPVSDAIEHITYRYGDKANAVAIIHRPKP